MLLNPINKAMADTRAYRGFMISQPRKKITSTKNKNGKARPRKEMNHHQLRGFSTGTRQARRKNKATARLPIKKIRLVKRLIPVAIEHEFHELFLFVLIRVIRANSCNSCYKSSWLALRNNSFSSSVRCWYPFWFILSRISSIRCWVILGVFL